MIKKLLNSFQRTPQDRPAHMVPLETGITGLKIYFWRLVPFLLTCLTGITFFVILAALVAVRESVGTGLIICVAFILFLALFLAVLLTGQIVLENLNHLPLDGRIGFALFILAYLSISGLFVIPVAVAIVKAVT